MSPLAAQTLRLKATVAEHFERGAIKRRVIEANRRWWETVETYSDCDHIRGTGPVERLEPTHVKLQGDRPDRFVEAWAFIGQRARQHTEAEAVSLERVAEAHQRWHELASVPDRTAE